MTERLTISGLDYITFPDDFVLTEKKVSRRGGILDLLPGQSQTGYGKKITTDRMALLTSGKSYRVYATCYSNAASHWIMIKGKKYFLRGI